MPRVVELIPQIIEEVEPEEEEDVDGHPDHLQTQTTTQHHHGLTQGECMLILHQEDLAQTLTDYFWHLEFSRAVRKDHLCVKTVRKDHLCVKTVRKEGLWVNSRSSCFKHGASRSVQRTHHDEGGEPVVDDAVRHDAHVVFTRSLVAAASTCRCVFYFKPSCPGLRPRAQVTWDTEQHKHRGAEEPHSFLLELQEWGSVCHKPTLPCPVMQLSPILPGMTSPQPCCIRTRRKHKNGCFWHFSLF